MLPFYSKLPVNKMIITATEIEAGKKDEIAK